MEKLGNQITGLNKKELKKRLLLAICLFSFLVLLPTACVEEFQIESQSYDQLLVVDGSISDRPGTHEIRISYTVPIDSEADNNPVTGAEVWVEDNLSNRTDFIEANNGIYRSPIGFAGVRGRSYSLFITTEDGRQYQSTPQLLVASPEISKVYNRFEVISGNETEEALPGAQFFIDVDDAAESTQFYRYEWNDTHQVIVPYTKNYHATLQISGDYTITSFDEEVKECYRERKFNELILATSAGNVSGQLKEVPIKFSPSNDFDVTTAYSIEITQRAISAEAYSFYRKLELFNESNGSLFDKQQGMIVGNIVSRDNPNEKVLGYFEVSGETTRRVFLELSDLAEGVLENTFRPCYSVPLIEYDQGTLRDFYEANDVEEGQRQLVMGVRSQYELFDIMPGLSGPTYLLAHRFCVDCTYNGIVGKPDYWP